ncbi:MAG: hypothetical protein ABFS02_06615 [Pseudomonadota bacterium]
MSLTNILGKSNLKRAIKRTKEARTASGEQADELFREAYRNYAATLRSDPDTADALNNWGSALFFQGLTKTGEDAVQLFRTAGEKFSACLIIDPGIPSAAIDWGVALMEEARASGFAPSHSLYDQAREKFFLAEKIQAGSASYNLACIHSLRNEHDECLKYLKAAQEHGNLPEPDQIAMDSDLGNVRDTSWFQAFLDSLKSGQPKIEFEGPDEEKESTDA